MRTGLFLLLLPALAVFTVMTPAQTPEEFAKAWDEFRISEKPASDTRLADLKNYLGKLPVKV